MEMELKKHRRGTRGTTRATFSQRRDSRDSLSQAVARSKQAMLRDFSESAEEHLHVLKLALNEAEALAWSTNLPHLFFPALALEKAEAAVRWHKRQRAVRKSGPALSFAE